MRQYSSPKNPTIKEQVYAFLLFEQTDNITISDEMRVKLSQYMVGVAYNYTDVFTELQLQGLYICMIRSAYNAQVYAEHQPLGMLLWATK